MSVETPTSTSIFRVEFPRVIYSVAKSYSMRALKVTSTANGGKAAQKWFLFPGIIVRDIRLNSILNIFFLLIFFPSGPDTQSKSACYYYIDNNVLC